MLQKPIAGIHFLLFQTTLQRGGTCKAHPPPPEGMPCVPDINAFILSVPASKLNASELGFRFLPPRPSPILLFLPPDPHIPPHFVRNLLLRPQNAIFWPSKNHLIFCFHFFSEKMQKSWILASQNPSEIRPKCLQNQCPAKPAFCHRFFAYFGCFRLCALFLRSA